jgi:hypothetical protein
MNRLSVEKRAAIVGALVEGNSIRATCRMTGASKNTVTKLLVDLGYACGAYARATLEGVTVPSVMTPPSVRQTPTPGTLAARAIRVKQALQYSLLLRGCVHPLTS